VRSITVRRLGRLVPAVLTVLVAVSIPAAAHAACADRNRSPDEISAAAVRTATLCLVNAKRRAHDLRPLRHATKLIRAARRHSHDMVRHDYFAHDSRSGASFGKRIARTGWMRGRKNWVIGENLAWGGGSRSTPRVTVAAWMHSPAHRRNILHGRFRVIGIGVAHGVPVSGGGAGATYTTDFGS